VPPEPPTRSGAARAEPVVLTRRDLAVIRDALGLLLLEERNGAPRGTSAGALQYQRLLDSLVEGVAQIGRTQSAPRPRGRRRAA
jgi:hypothetical protein